MTGADQYNKPQLLKLKSIRLNGDTGKWVVTHLDEPKDADNRYKQSEIEGPISVVFLKVRRKLFEGSRDGIVGSTNEHNTPNDVVMLHYKSERIQGIARELRERYDSLRTEQIVYVRHKGEIMRLSVKGKSLSGDDDTTNFYQYLTSFQDSEIQWWETMTKLVPHLGGDGKRSYYYIDFQIGDALSAEQKEQVFANIKQVHENCTKVDAFYQVSSAITAEKDAEIVPEQLPEYPEEEIDPKDIPF